MKAIKNLNFIWVVLFLFNLPTAIGDPKTSNLYAQDPLLINNSWFVHSARDSNVSNFVWDNSTLTFQELKFEITFQSNKIIVEGCCGGLFEMDVNYINNFELEILDLNEIESIPCEQQHVTNFYHAIKGSFTSMIGETIAFAIQNNPFESGIKDILFNHPSNSSFIKFLNTPNEINDQAQAPYWGQELPMHQWSLTRVLYEGQTHDLPYGAALTVADIFEGTFLITICGEIFVALNFSWYLDVEELIGPCFISCGNLENTTAPCEPIAGIDESYLQTFKQNAYNFLIDNIDQTMEYEFDFGTSSHNARKLIISDFSQNKLIFHSTDNFLNIVDTPLSSKISVYPNPVIETLHINQNKHQFVTAIIYNVQGKKMGQHLLENSKSIIDVKSFIAGLYFLVLESEKGERVTQKLVKK